VALGLSRALRGVGWGWLEPAVSSPGQPRPLLPSQGRPAAPTSAWAPALGTVLFCLKMFKIQVLNISDYHSVEQQFEEP